MRQKSRGIALLVLVVVLLVIVSSRVSPQRDYSSSRRVRTTDDPYYATEAPQTFVLPAPASPTPAMRIQEAIPGVTPNDWNLRLVNNTYVLSNSFAPDVSEITPGSAQYFDSRAIDALRNMITAAEEAGYTVHVLNGYRPYSTQAYIFFGRASQIQWGTDMEMIEAEALARKVVAYPGTSEHQLGLAVDLMDSPTTEMDSEKAKDIPVLQWLTEHCDEYGFILRYPEDKEEITGWYEPWHFRYVGEDAAGYIMENGLCLEEFISLF